MAAKEIKMWDWSV